MAEDIPAKIFFIEKKITEVEAEILDSQQKLKTCSSEAEKLFLQGEIKLLREKEIQSGGICVNLQVYIFIHNNDQITNNIMKKQNNSGH